MFSGFNVIITLTNRACVRNGLATAFKLYPLNT